HVDEDIETFLNAHRPYISNEKFLASFYFRISRREPELLQIGPVAHDKHIAWIAVPSFNRQSPIAFVGRHHHITQAEGYFLEPDLRTVQGVFAFVLRQVEFRIGVVMIEDVFNAKEPEGQRDQNDIVRWIA